MPKWGRSDQAITANATTTVITTTGAPIGTYALVKGSGRGTTPIPMGSNAHFANTSPGSRTNVSIAMFNNTTMGAFITGKAVGIFGASAAETGQGTGQLSDGVVTFNGSGYAANAAVTLTVVNGGSSATVNATANSTGRISSLLIQANGSGYIANPTVAIAAPSPLAFIGNTTFVQIGNTTNTGWIVLGLANTALFANGDQIKYLVVVGNTAIGGLTNNNSYFIYQQNTSTVTLSSVSGGAMINLASVGTDTIAGQSVTGQTATGAVTVSANGSHGITHAGWLLRTEGSGGRAGRVTYETLVAYGSHGANTTSSTGVYGPANTVTDATTDNTVLPGL
jgi:hypothetical protein